jgi:hypothetical protein
LTFAVLLLASIHAVDAAPFSSRATSQSPSFASLPKPIFAPYYVYFGNDKVAKMADAFDSLGMKAVTVAFASAPSGKVSAACFS